MSTTTGPATAAQPTVTTPSDREVAVTRAFAAPRTLVFDALIEPDLLKRWLTGPPGWSLAVCEVDPRVGGAFRHVWHGPNGAALGMGGVYREVSPPERLVRTERFDEDWTGGETLGTVVLTERGEETTLALTLLYASREARDAALGSGMEQGLAASYDRLAEVLAAMPVPKAASGAA